MTLHSTDAPDPPHGSTTRRIGLVALTGILAAMAQKGAWSKTAVALPAFCVLGRRPASPNVD